MALVRGKDTRPERTVRRLIFSLGYRYRLHDRRLPGRPDIVFGPRRKVVLVNGCFWHRHAGCEFARMPKSRSGFWSAKLNGNVRRDARNRRALNRDGWRVLTVWECEVADTERLARRVRRFLNA